MWRIGDRQFDEIHGPKRKKKFNEPAVILTITALWGLTHMDINLKAGASTSVKVLGRDIDGDLTSLFTSPVWSCSDSGTLLVPSADGKTCAITAGLVAGLFTVTVTAQSVDANNNPVTITSPPSTLTITQKPAVTLEIDPA